MKFALGLILACTLFASTAFAVSSGATPLRLRYGTTNLTTSAYVQLVALTAKGIKGVSVAHSGSSAVYLAFGAAGSEVNQVLIPGSSLGTGMFYIPVNGGYGLRISAEAADATNSAGELDVNLIYN